MRRYEKLVLLLIALVVITRLCWFGSDLFVVYYLGTTELIETHRKTIESVSSVLTYVLNFGSALWLFTEAKKKGINKWICGLLFGLFFSLRGVLLYYLIQIYMTLKNKNVATEAKT